MIGERGHVGAEHDLVDVASQEVGHRATARLQQGVGFGAARVGPMGVGVVMQEIVGHRGCDGVGHLCASGAIEVGDRVSGLDTLQGGKVAADLADVGDGHCVSWFWILPQRRAAARKAREPSRDPQRVGVHAVAAGTLRGYAPYIDPESAQEVVE